MDSVSPVHFLAFPFSVCGLSFSVGSNCWGQFEMSDLNVRILKNVKKLKMPLFLVKCTRLMYLDVESYRTEFFKIFL